MAESSDVLVEHHKWAQLAITHVLGTHGSGAVLWQKHPLGFSSMFSGTCYPERALTYISAARRDVAPDSKDLSDPVWTCEIDSKARASQRDAVPDTACKFENIEHFINAGALAEMKKVKGKHGGKRFQKWWAIAKKATFNTHAYCTQHLRKCPIRKSIADTTGSICKSYSTMGNMELDDSENSIPLVIWLAYHLNHRTPLLVHENVRGFLSTILSDQAVEAGYEVCQAKCDPKDIGIPVGRPRKFDIFWHPDFLECLGDIAKTYSELASVVLNGLPKCRINDLFFETDEQALRLEMKRQSSSASEGAVASCDLSDWTSLLTDNEVQNLEKYRKKFHEKFGEVDLEPVFALAQNPDKMPTMTSAHGVLPCFTTSNNRLWHDGLKRWMTAREKMAASGLPVSSLQVQAAKLCQGEAVDWQSDYSWHKRVGNGQQLQNVGLVLMAIFLNLKFKDSLPAGFFDIQPPSQPEGLVELEDKTYLLSIGGGGFKVPSKEIALKAHGALHEKNLELQGMNVEGLKNAMSKLVTGGIPKAFSQANKTTKKAMLLQQWFEKVLIPQFESHSGAQKLSLQKPKPETHGQPGEQEAKPGQQKAKPGKQEAKSEQQQKDLFQTLRNHKPDVLHGEVEETPELLAKILIFSREWLDLILEGKKCIELRKTKISASLKRETFYLGVKDTIYARCDVSPGVKIENAEQFDMLKEGHQWQDPKPPYGYPFTGHALSQVQRVKPLEFQKAWGSIGRALYRPPGWGGAADDDVEEKPQTEGASSSSKIEEDEEKAAGSKEKKVKGKFAKKKKKTGTAQTGTTKQKIACLPPTMLEGQEVEIVDPAAHLQPSSARLDSKKKQLQRKFDQANADAHISGGALAHLNNLAFSRSPSVTASYLLGHTGKDKGLSVNSLWVPGWDAQAEMEKWVIDNPDLKKWASTFKPAMQVLGLCLVVPDHEAPAVSKLMVFDSILKGSSAATLIFGLVGSDRRCTMYRITDEGTAEELRLEVHWVGERSLYTAHVVAQELVVVEKLKEEAKMAFEKKSIWKSIQQRKQEQNAKRRPEEDKSEQVQVTAEIHLRKVIDQLQHVADFLLESLSNFHDDTMPQRYQACLRSYPLAEFELSKAVPEASKWPATIAQAGQRMAMALQLKNALELRLTKRKLNTSHTYDGFKSRRKTCSTHGSSASGTPKVRRLESSSAQSTERSQASQRENEEEQTAPKNLFGDFEEAAEEPSVFDDAEENPGALVAIESPKQEEASGDLEMQVVAVAAGPGHQDNHARDLEMQLAPIEPQDEEGEENESDGEQGKGGKPRNRLSIYQKMQAIREMDRLIEEGRTSGIEKAVMNTFPHFFAGAKGNKTGMLGRWKTQCDKQNWRQIPWERLSNNDRQMKELPDWIRLPMGLLPRAAERFKEGGNVPPCITNKLVSLVDRITTGGEHSQLTGGTLNTKEIKKEAERLLSIYRKTQAEYAEANGKAAPPCKEKISDRWVNRFLAHFGWRRRTPNTYGAYLAYDDERMEKSRKMFQFRRLQKNIRLDLCINFDQVWKASWTHPKKVFHRAFGSDGVAGNFLRRKRDAAMTFLATLQERATEWQAKRRRVRGKGCEQDARADNVAVARQSITLVTSLWGNGEAGPLTVILPLGFLKDEERGELEEKFRPDIYFVSSGRASHFMNAEVVVQFYEHVLVDCFDRRRCELAERYSKSFQDEWGLILCDSFTGHHSTGAGTDIQREHFSQNSRVVLPDKQPGGWSARGQPCDAVHAVYRRYMSEYTETTLGYRNSLVSRATSDPILMSNSNVHLAVSHTDSVLSAIYGWKKLAFQKRMLRWAWLSRGMASFDDILDFNPNLQGLDQKTLKEEMRQCEISADFASTWESPLEEVFTRPDVQRTTFLWQIEVKDDMEIPWEQEDEEEKELNSWRCMPSHWQSMLNARLAEFNAKVQDAEAFHLHRQKMYGDDDLKTKNALKKFDSLRAGEGASSVILISKATGKEASPDVYNRAVSRSKGSIKVQCGPKITGYRLNVKDMTLELLAPPAGDDEQAEGNVKHLRIVSVTGRSRELQEIRVHLTALSLSNSDVLRDSGLKVGTEVHPTVNIEEPNEDAQNEHNEAGGNADDMDMQKQLVALNQGEAQFEAAEHGLEELIPNHAAEETDLFDGQDHHVPDKDDHAHDSDHGFSEEEQEVVFEFEDCDAAFVCKGKGEEAAGSSDLPPVGVVPSGTIKTTAAFLFLDQIGLTEVPNVQGVGMGVHLTTKCW